MKTTNGFNERDRLISRRKHLWRGGLMLFAATAISLFVCAGSLLAQSDGSADMAIDRVYADGPLALRVSLDHTKVTTPGQVRLSFIFTFEEGVEVQTPEFDRTVAGFLVVSQDQAEPNTLRGVTTFSVELVLESSLPGMSKLGPFQFRYRDTRESASDASVHTISTEPIEVLVVSGLADVSAPVALPTPMWRVIVGWGIIALAGGAVIWLVVARVRSSGRRQSAVEVKSVQVAAHVWATAELDTLSGAFGRQAISLKDYHFRINAVLRGYIERRYGINAGEQTSEELLAAVRREATFEPKHRELLDRFVRACDPVKYAAQEATDAAAAWLDQTAREFVTETADRGEAADAAKQGGSRAGT